MTTTAKDVAAKFAVAAVAVAMIFSAFAAPAQAQTTEDLQQMINDLLAQVAQLQASTGQGATSVASGVCPYSWTRDLTNGSRGADVMKLQQFLNANADTRVAASGAGSVGMETEFYGPATAAAVSKMQVMYRAEVLTPGGLVNPTGYFGPSSRAKANSLCTSAPVVEETEEGEMTEEEEEEVADMTLRGEGTLDEFEIRDADDTDIQEGSEDEVIAELTFEATDGDLELDRINMTINATAATEEDPWEVFETISLWVDGDMIAEFDASDEDEYLNEDRGEFRFSGLGLFLEEDEEVEVLVAATVFNNVDDAGTTAAWEIQVDEVRYFDADGVAENDDSTGDMDTSSSVAAPVTVGFDIVEAGDGEELRFSTASNNPDATDIIVDLDGKTNGITILSYNIEARDADIELNTLFVEVLTGTVNSNLVIDDIALEIDGRSFDAENNPSSTGASTIFEFDIDGDITIDEDDEVTVEVVVDFRSQEVSTGVSRYANGTTIEANVTSTQVDATDAEGSDDINEFRGTANGEAHTLVAEGIVVPVDSVETSADASGDQDQFGEFSIEFDVTAVEGTFYINDLATIAATDATALLGGVQFDIQGGTATNVSATLSSTADEATNGAFEIADGETETFKLDVTFQTAAGAQFRLVLGEVWYSLDDDGENALPYLTVPASDFRTDFKQVNNI